MKESGTIRQLNNITIPNRGGNNLIRTHVTTVDISIARKLEINISNDTYQHKKKFNKLKTEH